MSTRNNKKEVAPNGATFTLHSSSTHVGVSKRASFVMALLLFVLCAAGGVFLHKYFAIVRVDANLKDLLIAIISIVLIPFLHEFIHAIGYRFVGVKFPHISIHFKWKDLSLYCVADKKINLFMYRFVSIFPLFLIGILPYVIAFLFLNFIHIGVFAISISLCSFDVLIFFKSLKYPGRIMVLDHPVLPGFIIEREC